MAADQITRQDLQRLGCTESFTSMILDALARQQPDAPSDPPALATGDRWRFHGLEALAAKHPYLEPAELLWLSDRRKVRRQRVAAAVLAAAVLAVMIARRRSR